MLGRAMQTVANKLKTNTGKRFRRFLVAAVMAVAASQITLTICLGVLQITAGTAAILAWLAGAATSYLMSRWAWERKGRPHLLRETLPFWTVSVVVAAILTTSARLANHEALTLDMTTTSRVLFVDGVYFLTNCLTFLARFVVFHYLLFADKDGTARMM